MPWTGSTRSRRRARAGFYTGHVGVAYAAALIGRSLERADLEAHARRGAGPPRSGGGRRCGGRPPLGRHRGHRSAPGPGSCISTDPSVTRSRDAAGPPDRRGRDRSDDGWSWPVSAGGIEASRPLTGLAHGAAGIGWSLLELGVATGAQEMIEAAHQAFRYEDRWFRPAEDNWPDFREEDGDDAPACVAWCHGARGSGSPACARSSSDSMPTGRSAEAAMRTTRSSLGRSRRLDRRRFLSLSWSCRAGRSAPLRVSRARPSPRAEHWYGKPPPRARPGLRMTRRVGPVVFGGAATRR